MRSLLSEIGAHVRVERLAVGDYVVADGCIVERKHVVDLHDSLLRGRLWPQLGRLRVCAAEPYLLVEGVTLRGPIRPDGIRGALLAAAELGVTVIRSVDRSDSAFWLYRLAHRRQVAGRRRIRPRYAQRPKSPADEVAAAMLSAVPGISYVTARSLLARFESIAGLLGVPSTEWRTVRGVGRERCNALAAALGLEQES